MLRDTIVLRDWGLEPADLERESSLFVSAGILV